MEFALVSILSQLLGLQCLKEDIDNFVSAVQFLLKTLANLYQRLVQFPHLCDCQHFRSSCNGSDHDQSSRGDKESNMSASEVGVVIDRLLENSWRGDGDHDMKMGLEPERFASLFEEEEPSLEEIRMAFGVYDRNKDGYIDAGELQRVVCELGLKETGLEECKKMMRPFDRNGDGLMDIDDFLKMMEKCLF